MTGLPPGWVQSTLGEIGRYVNGRGFKKSEWRESGRPIIRIQNLTGSSSEFNYFDGEADERHVVHQGDLLVSWAATLGVYKWAGNEAVLNQHIFKVDSHIHQEFHRYLLQHTLNDLYRQAHGSGMVHITKGKFDSTPVLLPPLSEQGRIVAAIEEHFSHLDAAEACLQRALLNLDRLSRSRTAELLDGVQPTRRLDSVSQFVTDGDHRPPKRTATGVPHLTAKHIKSGTITTDGCTFVSEEGYRQTAARYDPCPGDVIVTCVGTIGEVAVVPPGLTFSADRNLAAVRLTEDGPISPDWLEAVLTSPAFKHRLMKASGSTAQPHLYLKDLRALEIPVPASEDQERIAAHLLSLRHLSSRVAAEIERSRRRGQLLRRSILGAAFSGELVPHDPTDEPASGLLERIREAASAKKPSRRKKHA